MLYVGIAVFVLLIILTFVRSSFIYLSIAINIPPFPFAYIAGTLMAGGPDTTIFDFLKGFLLIQGIPLIILITHIVVIIKNRWKTKSENQVTEE